jgi:hypothetical protein
MNSTTFCITGWHFPEGFYQTLSSQGNIDIYIISHKKQRELPRYIFELFREDQILFQSNIGYDWGCYQQFLNSGLWSGSEVIVFMHDDIQIRDFGFIDRVKDLLETYQVIGNGRGEGSVSFTGVREHPYAYAHSTWRPGSYDFQHPTVRGSFFALKRQTLEELSSFEVYWDPYKLNIDFGNWSTKATCGKMEAYLGPDCFGYLSDTFGKSAYITEFVRGEEGGRLSELKGIKGGLYTLIKRLSRVYMEIVYEERDLPLQSAWPFVLRTLLCIFSSKLY